MVGVRKHTAAAGALILCALSGTAWAQTDSGDLMALDKGALRGEVQKRFDGAVAKTTDATVVSADSSTYMWASQAKAQCGIALGFLKSGAKDPVSVGKCADAYAHMENQMPAAQAAVFVPPAAAAPAPCNKGPYIVFFDWNSAAISEEGSTILNSAAAGTAGCTSGRFSVSGYADRSGSETYNMALSQRRADVVRDFLTGQGVSAANVTTKAFGETNPRVPTADGVRELQNRRVEITVE
ncbi:OmpA family protein [Novosphingobium sp.]|uniref:OmpA family protein n=1 Tax=Novosphingobium sp. TaxID=1874826 RepID=UPI002FD8BF65